MGRGKAGEYVATLVRERTCGHFSAFDSDSFGRVLADQC